MAIFNRKKSNGNKAVSKDVQKYYKSGKRERVGLAWLIAFVSLIITIAVVMGLFFGGRWIYRQVTDDEPSQPTTQETNNTSGQPESSSQNQGQPNASQPSSNQPSATQPTTPTPTGTSSTSTQTPSTSTPQPAQPPANTGKLNSTGPEHNAAIFVAVTILGAILHNRYLKRRINQV